ncbi:MAG: PepSY domain-containing protein [Halolamina sp.]
MELTRRGLLGALGIASGGGAVGVVAGRNGQTADRSRSADDCDCGRHRGRHHGSGDRRGRGGARESTWDGHHDGRSEADVSLSAGEAEAVATDAVDGTVQFVELDREHGVTVYEVVVETPEGTTKQVFVEADDGIVIDVTDAA